MFNKQLTIVLGFSIFILIVFDAFQQQYYVETFNLNTSDSSILYFIKSHSLRWLIWLVGSIPYIIFSRKIFHEGKIQFTPRKLQQLIGSVSVSIGLILIVISLVSMLLFSESVTYSFFKEWFIFIFFQKALSFSLASTLLVLLIYNNSNKQVINAQWVEINSLKQETIQFLSSQENQSLSIKIGNRVKVIQLNDVYWIESDDYCVKIHTKDRAYSLRKSLKSLEDELRDFNFIRVHRKALINLNFLDHVDFGFGLVKLTDDTEVPLSKAGARLLKKVVS